MNILNRKVLVLNAAWLPTGTKTVKKVLEDMNSSRKPHKALKIEYALDQHGQPDFSKPVEVIPLAWAEWITLNPRPHDEHVIRTPKLEIRVPTVAIVGSDYNKLPVKTFRPTKKNIYERYGGKDYWTGEQLSYKDCTLDHVHARSKGGYNSWDNLAPTSGKINRLKADMPAEEFTKKYGYKPQYRLHEPPPVTAQVLIAEICPDWSMFLVKGS